MKIDEVRDKALRLQSRLIRKEKELVEKLKKKEAKAEEERKEDG